jgi:hypothetical protein
MEVSRIEQLAESVSRLSLLLVFKKTFAASFIIGIYIKVPYLNIHLQVKENVQYRR